LQPHSFISSSFDIDAKSFQFFPSCSVEEAGGVLVVNVNPRLSILSQLQLVVVGPQGTSKSYAVLSILSQLQPVVVP